MKQSWEDKPLHDHLLYVVDGELLNHMIKIMSAYKMSPELENWLWECGIKLPNPDDPDNQYPEEDQ